MWLWLAWVSSALVSGIATLSEAGALGTFCPGTGTGEAEADQSGPDQEAK